MELTPLQKSEIAAWFAAGASLDEIQKRIKSTFGVHMTYLDVRLLVADLPQPTEAEEPHEEPDAGNGKPSEAQAPVNGSAGEATPPPRQGEAGQPPSDGAQSGADAQTDNEGQAVQAPTVTIDALMIPGTLASGDVTFSDGQTGKWYLDQMGRLGLGGSLPQGYRPSPTDAALFQQQLMQLLQSKGLC